MRLIRSPVRMLGILRVLLRYWLHELAAGSRLERLLRLASWVVRISLVKQYTEFHLRSDGSAQSVWKNSDAVARASLCVRGKARCVDPREFGEPNDRRIRAARCRHGRPEAAAVGGWFFHMLSVGRDLWRYH